MSNPPRLVEPGEPARNYRPRAELPLTKLCELYHPGHAVHWIQARRSREDLDRRTGRVVDISGEIVVVTLGGDNRSFRHHDPARLAALVDRYGPTVAVKERWSTVLVGEHYVSVARDEGQPLQSCRFTTPEERPGPSILMVTNCPRCSWTTRTAVCEAAPALRWHQAHAHALSLERHRSGDHDVFILVDGADFSAVCLGCGWEQTTRSGWAAQDAAREHQAPQLRTAVVPSNIDDAGPTFIAIHERGSDVWCLACQDYDCACDPPLLEDDENEDWEIDGEISEGSADESYTALWSDLLQALAEAGLLATTTSGAIALVEIPTTVGTVYLGGAEGGLPRDRTEHTGWTARLTTAQGSVTRRIDAADVATAVVLILGLLPAEWTPSPRFRSHVGCIVTSEKP